MSMTISAASAQHSLMRRVPTSQNLRGVSRLLACGSDLELEDEEEKLQSSPMEFADLPQKKIDSLTICKHWNSRPQNLHFHFSTEICKMMCFSPSPCSTSQLHLLRFLVSLDAFCSNEGFSETSSPGTDHLVVPV